MTRKSIRSSIIDRSRYDRLTIFSSFCSWRQRREDTLSLFFPSNHVTHTILSIKHTGVYKRVNNIPIYRSRSHQIRKTFGFVKAYRHDDQQKKRNSYSKWDECNTVDSTNRSSLSQSFSKHLLTGRVQDFFFLLLWYGLINGDIFIADVVDRRTGRCFH